MVGRSVNLADPPSVAVLPPNAAFSGKLPPALKLVSSE